MVACVLSSRIARLARPDPARAAELWDEVVGGLERVGAAVESGRPGEAFFAVDGLVGIHGGTVAGVVAAARRAAMPGGTGKAPLRIAVAPTRFAAYAAAAGGFPLDSAAAGEETIVPADSLRAFLASLPVAALAGRLDAPAPREGELIGALKRLGLDTLGGLAALSPAQLADRFGALGLRALGLARGEDAPLRPRAPRVELAEEIELPDGVAGAQLDRAVELLVDRLLAAPGRRERTLLALRLSARLAGAGSWSVEQALGRPSASPGVLRSLLVPKLEGLPEPARSLRLRALALGPPAADQLELAVGGGESRRNRLAAAAREVRAAAGPEALLRVVEVDPGSRVPERRALLAPYLDR